MFRLVAIDDNLYIKELLDSLMIGILLFLIACDNYVYIYTHMPIVDHIY